MVEIIREGKLPGLKQVKHECSNCHTIFKFLLNEARVTFDQRNGDFATIQCPLCNSACHVGLEKFE